MPKTPHSTGTFVATLAESERKILIDVQDRIRAERSLGNAPQETIELPLQWCQEAVALLRRGKVSSFTLSKALDWSLRNPTDVQSIEQVLGNQGMLHMHEKGDPQGELNKHEAQHAQWRATYAIDPARAVREATRAVLVSGKGLCNPAEINQAVATFFAEPAPGADAAPSPH